ncbi:Rieske (2Fe-2S) protein [Rothia amarae]|uniref:Rieske (2Fe-2S) protein n=1 Tax=Rothia amarae TaxID=169480 RepID=UPI0033F31878
MENEKTTETGAVSRRLALGGAGVGVAGVTLTACGSNDSDAGKSAEGGLTEAKKPSAPTDIAAAADVPVGSALKATSGDLSVMVTQPSEGKFKAFSSVCTHQGCQLNVQNKNLACPCHASQFSIEDGSVKGGPAPEPLPEYAVEVKDGRIIVS